MNHIRQLYFNNPLSLKQTLECLENSSLCWSIWQSHTNTYLTVDSYQSFQVANQSSYKEKINYSLTILHQLCHQSKVAEKKPNSSIPTHTKVAELPWVVGGLSFDSMNQSKQESLS